MKAYTQFLEKTKKIYLLNSVSELIEWDRDTIMPELERDAKGMQKELLAKIKYEELISEEMSYLLKQIKPDLLNTDEKCNYYYVKLKHEREKRVPTTLISKIENATSKANGSWLNARINNDFNLFKKDLENVIKLKKEYAKKINPKSKPYEVLFEDYEQDISYEEAKKLILNTYYELKDLIKSKSINLKKNEDIRIKESIQKEFCEKLLKDIGYDFNKGLLETSAHPFTTMSSFGRITTRYTDNWIFTILSTMHEGGHALYEQGLPLKHYATPRGSSKDMSIHESQSRIWENHVGRSEEFWKYQYPHMKKKYNLKINFDEFMKKIMTSKRDFIRVNADELTYIVHILIRMEIEEELINGNLKVKDAPKKWNELYKKYLGITPRDDNEGILQDVHWSFGGFGYFPTYVLGSMIAAQLFHYADKELNLKNKFKKGNYQDLLNWLKNEIHVHGRKYSVQELIKKATGEKLTNKYYVMHLKERYNNDGLV